MKTGFNLPPCNLDNRSAVFSTKPEFAPALKALPREKKMWLRNKVPYTNSVPARFWRDHSLKFINIPQTRWRTCAYASSMPRLSENVLACWPWLSHAVDEIAILPCVSEHQKRIANPILKYLDQQTFLKLLDPIQHHFVRRDECCRTHSLKPMGAICNLVE